MSGTQSSPYTRENFWGETNSPDTSTETSNADEMARPPEGYTYDLARWKAHKILKDTARKLCGKSYAESNIEIELTEPDIYPPDDPVARQGYATRYNPERGYISGPHDTWVQLGDRPREDFLDLIESLLDLWRVSVSLTERECDCLREQARKMKANQDTADEEIVTRLILAVEDPNSVLEYF